MLQKPIKRRMKNVIKNLVKENQRIHDYKSPYGVKFWNKILKDSKYLAKNHKVFEQNLLPIIERDYEYYNRMLKEDIEEEKKEIFRRRIYQLEPFIDGRWRDMINEDARVKEEYRWILWKENAEEDKYNVNETRRVEYNQFNLSQQEVPPPPTSQVGRMSLEETEEKYDIIQIIDALESLVVFAKAKLREIEVFKIEKKIIQIGNIANHITSTRENCDRYRVYSTFGVFPTLNTMGGGVDSLVS